jgi:proline iminopeptidase
MDNRSEQKAENSPLYPAIDPFSQEMLDVGDGHKVYLEQSGAQDGYPVVVVHGGPGAGCSASMRRYFDPTKYRIIMFDQRGCGRSLPYASIEQNTTWDLVRDMEKIRTHLGVDKWAVFGGSWGATLSLIYAQTHPESVSDLILRGVFLMTQPELDWFYGGGAGKFWPELWQRFVSVIPEEERDDLIAAYHKRLFSGDMREEMRFGTTWTNWENALASFQSNGLGGHCPPAYARTFARIENHYFINDGFLKPDQKILSNMEKVRHIQGYIVQGRYDMICPPAMAYEVSRKWPRCDLRIISHAGHAMSEPKISAELVSIMDKLRFQSD